MLFNERPNVEIRSIKEGEEIPSFRLIPTYIDRKPYYLSVLGEVTNS